MQNRPEPETIVITGGSAGIGRSIAEHCLAIGRRVVSVDRQEPAFRHANLEFIQADLADCADTDRAAAAAAAFRPLGFVHNAGVIRPALIADARPEDLRYLFDLHVMAAVRFVQAMLPEWERAGIGRIVLVGSRAALGLATRTGYSATKSALLGLARTLSLELGPKGITVNVVSPGPIVTDMFHEIVPADSPKKDALARSIPVGRLGRPDDVARAAMFFLDRANGFVTGQNLFVCGGTSVGSLTI
jgi:NAD(P)-dependent dehydrogenase (short-subunit alcohol dehydrogenase family)